ncbi:MAG: hypothetical protein AAGA80_02200 [Cyanobacteria bacterium P01_F01_bin.143]
MDADIREIVGVHIGDLGKARRCEVSRMLALRDRDEKTARKLWNSLPPVYRQCAS